MRGWPSGSASFCFHLVFHWSKLPGIVRSFRSSGRMRLGKLNQLALLAAPDRWKVRDQSFHRFEIIHAALVRLADGGDHAYIHKEITCEYFLRTKKGAFVRVQFGQAVFR